MNLKMLLLKRGNYKKNFKKKIFFFVDNNKWNRYKRVNIQKKMK